ncbi:MAG: ABC transporter substrate-binding protein [Thermomicrobiales bacterium]|nr:ABC transporter substrate-binding protein [Thermomicrobiales bacterium]
MITDLTSSRTSRRQFMQRAAALGLTVPALSASLGTLTASAQSGRNSVAWLSPRGTLEVLDDYPYWVAVKMGYFEDIEVSIDPAIFEATSSAKVVADGGGDMSYVSPGVFSLGVEAGIDLVSVWQMGAYDVFDIALPKGNPGGIATLKDLEGKNVVVGDLGWTGIVDPMVAQAGGDPSKVKYQAAGSGWGQALAEGQADAALCWAGLRAQWLAGGLDFDYIIGKSWSKFPANSFQIRRADAEDAALDDLYTRYLRGWAMGLEFGHQNPRAAVQITMEAEPIAAALAATFPDKGMAVTSMWQLADVYRGDFANRDGGKWGWADMTGWTTFLTTIKEIGQLTKDLAAEDIITNKYVAEANNFDKAKVKADADGYALTAEFEAVAVPAGAGTDGAYPS